MNKKTIFLSIVSSMAALSLVILPLTTWASGPKYGGTLRIGTRIPQFNRLDVRQMTTPSMVPATELIYERLFNWGKDGFKTLIPCLATSYETKDNKTWIIHLRKGVKFHNGREMTAEDVKANFDWRIKTPKGWRPVKYRELIMYLNRVEIMDKYTIKVVLDQPFSPLMRILSWAMRGISPPEEVEKWQEKFTFHPCGTGPFKVVEIKPKEKIVLERFEDYWGPRPYIDRVELKFIRSGDARLIALQKGEIDITQLFDEARPSLDKDPNLQYEEVVSYSTLHKHYFNVRRWPMSDVRFRKAMWMGADWRNIAVNSWPFKSGNYPRTLLDRTKYFNPDAMKLVPPYDPEEARRLVKEVERDAGKKIPPIYWLDSTVGSVKTAAELAKIQLAQVGITLDLHLMSHAIWFDKLLRDPKLEWDTGGYGYAFARSPRMGFTTFFTNSRVAPDGKSLGGYSNPEFDQWVVKAERAVDEKDQIRYYQEAEKVILKDAACIPIFFWRMVIAWNKRLKGVVNHPNGSIYVTNAWANVWLEK